MNQYWSYVLTVVGLVGFILAGRKVWWCWYVNVACQALWFTYAIMTKQYGFIVASVVYTVVFTQNAIKWTREHKKEIHLDEMERCVASTKNKVSISKEDLFINRPDLRAVILEEMMRKGKK